MARTVRDANLETRTARDRLKPSGKPYFRAIDQGLHIGYRKGKAGGRWVMRRYLGDQSYAVETIGSADDTLDPDGATILSFSQAQAIARTRFIEARRVAAGLPADAGPYRVKHAIADYLGFLETHRKSAADARTRAEALIIPALGDVEGARLTPKMLREWRDGLASSPARIRSGKTGQRFKAAGDDPDEASRRRRATANRTMTILKAALNLAWKDGRKISSDDAWRGLSSFREADAARVRWLTVDECRRLINAAQGSFRHLVQGALFTGCRYGELAALHVSDLNPEAGTLHVRTSKSGKGRHVVLTDEGITFFRRLAAGRSGRAPLLARDDGGSWGAGHQTRPMKEAVEAARLEAAANFHALRHSYASLTIMAGAPLMVVARNLGHADTRMAERHYGHLSKSYMADTIRASAPRFGLAESSVVSIAG